MRKTLAVLLTLVFIVAMVTTSFASGYGTILAGQTIPVTEKVDFGPDGIYIDMLDGYELEEVHVAVVQDPLDFPMTPSGNPKVGHFEHPTIELYDSGYDYFIPIDLETGDYVALHVVVVNECEEFEETGWFFPCGDTAIPFPGNNWAVYFELDGFTYED